MRYCVKYTANNTLLSINSLNYRLLFKSISRINKNEVKFFTELPNLKLLYETLGVQPFPPVDVITEDEVDLILAEEKLRK
jgi:hypothetical protein